MDADPPPLTGSFESRRLDYPAWRMAPCDDFYADWATAEFGPRAGPRIGPVFARLDCRLPRPSDWVNGPGGIVPDPRAWDDVSQEYAFVDELVELRPLIRGAGHLERFDYWLANFKYLRALGRVNCTWAELNAALDAMKNAPDAASRKDIAERKALPLRGRLIRELTYVQQYSAGHGQHAGGDGHGGQLAAARLSAACWIRRRRRSREATGEPLSGKATLPREYPGEPRLFVPVVRTSLVAGESLRLDAVVLGIAGSGGGLPLAAAGRQEFPVCSADARRAGRVSDDASGS